MARPRELPLTLLELCDVEILLDSLPSSGGDAIVGPGIEVLRNAWRLCEPFRTLVALVDGHPRALEALVDAVIGRLPLNIDRYVPSRIAVLNNLNWDAIGDAVESGVTSLYPGVSSLVPERSCVQALVASWLEQVPIDREAPLPNCHVSYLQLY